MLEGVFNSPQLHRLEAAIAFTARRHEVIAGNIANVTTPGFKAKDLSEKDFVEALRSADTNPYTVMTMIDSPDAGVVREDGNNVDIEREMAKLSKNGIMHNLLISLLNKQFEMLESALRERLL